MIGRSIEIGVNYKVHSVLAAHLLFFIIKAMICKKLKSF